MSQSTSSWLTRAMSRLRRPFGVPRAHTEAEATLGATQEVPGISELASGPIPTPVTRERIGSQLSSMSYQFKIDDDGDLASLLDGNVVWFLLLGEQEEILQVRGRWNKSVAQANRLSVLRATNDWNRDRIWPKVYVRDTENGLLLYVEVSFDLAHGATDAQLGQYLTCAVSTTGMALGSLSAMFEAPDA